MKKERVDRVLVDRGLCESREKAKRLVMARAVRINGRAVEKASDLVGESDALALVGAEKYVSRGGLKLEAALDAFSIDVSGSRALDVGASTGGFTDCLLSRGAARVSAVDVGQGQLAWKLRQDPRVEVMERQNGRYLKPELFGVPFVPFDIVVVDCSFISLKLILPPLAPLLRVGGDLIPLIKPQFEAGKTEVDRGQGVIRDPEIRQRIIGEMREFTESISGLSWQDIMESPIEGPAGNRESLAWIRRFET